VVLFLWSCPFIFGIILFKKRGTLSEPETKAKFGAMYEHHDPKRPLVGTYIFVFLMRRSFFVAMTFLMYYYPGI
jgi:hypothetical protein